MSSNKKFIELKKKKNGSLMLFINFDFFSVVGSLFKAIYSFVSWLDDMARFSFLLMFIGSIGLGFGMGIIVFSNPDITVATSFFQEKQLKPIQIEWMDDLFIIEEKQDPVVSLSNNIEVFLQSQYGNIAKQQTLVLYSHKLPFFEQTALGTQIKLIGENKGVYNYSVTQMQIIDRKDLQNVAQSNNKSLIIYQSDDLLSTQLLLIIAKLKS